MNSPLMKKIDAMRLREANTRAGMRPKAFPSSTPSLLPAKYGSSPLPLSKIVGNPNAILIASKTYPTASVVSPFKGMVRPLPAFAKSLEGRPIVAPNQTPARLEMRRILEQRERVIRASAGRRLALAMDTRTGFDWIKYDSRIRPTLPGRVAGLVKATDVAGVRATTADALRIPAGTTATIAAKGIASDAVPPAAVAALAAPAKSLPAPNPDGDTVALAATMPNANLSLIVVALIVGAMLFIMIKKGKR